MHLDDITPQEREDLEHLAQSNVFAEQGNEPAQRRIASLARVVLKIIKAAAAEENDDSVW